MRSLWAQFSTKAEIAGAKVKGMGGALGGLGAAAAVGVAVLAIVGANTQKAVTPIENVNKALADFTEEGNAAGKVEMDALFKNWDTLVWEEFFVHQRHEWRP